MTRILSLAILATVFVRPLSASDPDPTEVLVYGATPGGIAAAIAAASSGRSVHLVEPTQQIGGLITSGLSHTDFRTFEGLSGAYWRFSRRVEAYYTATYGTDSPQVRDSFRGTFGEPKVNLAVFEAMLAVYPNIVLSKGWRLAEVATTSRDNRTSIQSATFRDRMDRTMRVRCRVAIDASYEGDLMARVNVPWRAGREGRGEYDESLAPDQPDEQLQAYNFRFIMTRDPENRVTPSAPPNYRREDFVDVLKLLDGKRIKQVFSYPSECIFKAQTPPLPNGKYDINDVSAGLIRLSLPGQNVGWPDGTAEARQTIFNEHLRDQVGLLYFLQNDDAVPERFRQEAKEWGWCRDEFLETAHLPPQLYVREARRMRGEHIFTQHDSDPAPGDARAVWHRTAIACGDYGNNCHGTSHTGPRFGGRHSGEFYRATPPYQIPYGVLLPLNVDNLLVPVAASSSHVGFCALRLEPIWMSLGQAAGHSAALVAATDVSARNIDIAALQRRLHEDQCAIIYVSDVPPDASDFRAVQWWGTVGGLHGISPAPDKPGQRGKNIHGQYYEAYPGHAAALSCPLDATLADRWVQLAKQLKLDVNGLPGANGTMTRGDFIRAAFARLPDMPPPSLGVQIKDAPK